MCPETAGEQPVAVGVVDFPSRLDTGETQAAGAKLGPVVKVGLGVSHDGGAAGGAGGCVDAGNLVLRDCEHAERVGLAQVFLLSEGELGKI